MVSSYLCQPCRTRAEAEKQIANDRAKYRAKVNSPWDVPAFSADKKPKPIVLAEETGLWVSVRCPVPAIQMPRNADRRATFETDLNRYFGGFTSQAFIGGWVSENGKDMVEKGRVYEVSGPLNTFEVDLARMLFCKLGLDLGEQWMHIEVRHFDALHSKVNDLSQDTGAKKSVALDLRAVSCTKRGGN